MSVVRIVAVQAADAARVAERLRAQGHTVEIVHPGAFRVGEAEVEVRVERMPRREAVARILALAPEREVVLAPGVVTAEELREAARPQARRTLGQRVSAWFAPRTEKRREERQAQIAARQSEAAREKEFPREREAKPREAEQHAIEQRRREEELMRQEAARQQALALEAERRRQEGEVERRRTALEAQRREEAARHEIERQRALVADAERRRQMQEEEEYRRRQAVLQEQRLREEEARVEAERQRARAQEAEARRRQQEQERQRLLALAEEREWREAEAREAERQRTQLMAAEEQERVAAAMRRRAAAEAPPATAVQPAGDEGGEGGRALFSQKAAAARAATRTHMEALRSKIPRHPPAFAIPRRQRKWAKAAIVAVAISVAMMLGWAAAANRQPASPLPLWKLQSSQHIQEQLPFRNATATTPGAAATAAAVPAVQAQAPAAAKSSAAGPAAIKARKPARQSRAPRGGEEVVVRHYDAAGKSASKPQVARTSGVRRISDQNTD